MPDDKLTLDKTGEQSGPGSPYRALGKILKGIVHNDEIPLVPLKDKTKGRIFLTRPMFNMSSNNLQHNDTLRSLLSKDTNNIQTYIRQLLDPRLIYLERGMKEVDFLDNRLSFIAPFSNLVSSLTGFPDRTMPVTTSKPGPIGQTRTTPDGYFGHAGTVELDIEVDSINGSLFERIMSIWGTMISCQNLKEASPYMEDEVAGRTNWGGRLYSLELDATGTIVLGIAAVTDVYPLVDNIGKKYNFKRGESKERNTKSNYRLIGTGGVDYEEPRLIFEFNEHSAMLNMELSAKIAGLPHNLVKIPTSLKDKLGDTGYPYINDETMELEWWIDRTSGAFTELLSRLDMSRKEFEENA